MSIFLLWLKVITPISMKDWITVSQHNQNTIPNSLSRSLMHPHDPSPGRSKTVKKATENELEF